MNNKIKQIIKHIVLIPLFVLAAYRGADLTITEREGQFFFSTPEGEVAEDSLPQILKGIGLKLEDGKKILYPEEGFVIDLVKGYSGISFTFKNDRPVNVILLKKLVAIEEATSLRKVLGSMVDISKMRRENGNLNPRMYQFNPTDPDPTDLMLLSHFSSSVFDPFCVEGVTSPELWDFLSQQTNSAMHAFAEKYNELFLTGNPLERPVVIPNEEARPANRGDDFLEAVDRGLGNFMRRFRPFYVILVTLIILYRLEGDFFINPDLPLPDPGDPGL